MRLGRSITAVAGSTAITVIGIFLGASPWLWGISRGFQDWSPATKTDFWSGIGLVVLGLTTIMLYRVELNRRLELAGIISRMVKLEGSDEPKAAPDAADPKDSVSDEALLALAASVLKDIGDQKQPGAADAGATSLEETERTAISEDELTRIATSLLREIQATQPTDLQDTSGEKPLQLMSDSELFHMAWGLLEEIRQASGHREMVSAREEGTHE